MCISHFSKGSMWAKDPLSSRRRFIQSFPNERKKPSPVNQGKAGKRPHPALRATYTLWSNCHWQLIDLNSLRGAPPSQGKALYGAMQSCAPRGKYVLARRPVGPTWLPPLPSGGTSPIGKGKALMGIFLSVSVLGSAHSISREMSSAYLRKKSGPLSRNSSTDTSSNSSAWQAGSSRGRPKSFCIRRIR